MKKLDILLIFPKLGSLDNLVRDIPLSVVYAATQSVKAGYNVKIMDLRCCPDTWEQEVSEILDQGCHLVGVSVMTGNPIKKGLEISKYIKSKYDIPIVWGGPHPTLSGRETMENELIDFIIQGWGSEPLCNLIKKVKDDIGEYKDITGLGYREAGEIILNKFPADQEVLDYRDIPYHLVDINSEAYARSFTEELMFPIFSSVGCPYSCTFCITPAVSKLIEGKKWVPFEDEQVLGHMEYLYDKYKVDRFVFYDDDTFVNMKRMRRILEAIVERGMNKKFGLEFRGVRINEVDKMDKDYFDLLVEARTEKLLIGVESGSDKILKKMKKIITAEQILRANKKLSDYPSLRPHYNFFCGTPGETYEDLVKTKDLVVQLLEDNPHCEIGFGFDWKPLPGSVMTEQAIDEYGFVIPKNLEEWAEVDSYDSEVEVVYPWYTEQIQKIIKLLQLTGVILDKKKFMLQASTLPSTLRGVAIFLGDIYRPFLQLRLKKNNTALLFEHFLMNLFVKMFIRPNN
jgi:anaerobic magnesium-protoporphyrin IX monomethyl ester cyclase